MAKFKNGLTIIAFTLVTLVILETGKVSEFSSPASLEEIEEEHFLPHSRQRRDVSSAATLVEYEVVVELNLSDVVTLNVLRSLLSNGSISVTLSPTVNITTIDITTVCSPSSGGYQCRCEDQYRWSCDQCLTLGFCDNITGDTCGCINTIPPDGQYCQSVVQNNFTACPVTTPVPTPVPTSPAVVYEYIISIELNVSDVAAINQLRNILSNISYPVIISNQIQIYDINITTVCSPSSGGYQCRCEDQYRWSCDQCLTLGFCDNITGDTCGCINTIPPDGQYCQSVVQNNFTACPVTTPVPTPVPTSPAVVYEYIISIELNVSDVAAINQLRNILSNISYPVIISNQIQIYDINITTVCSPSSGGYQCRCEDQYRWSCDQCLTLGFCDNITGDTCGCINTIPPDGQYCQSVVQNNFTACPVTTPVPTPVPTSPAVVYEYIISIELNVSDVAAINQLRNILSNISYPVIISNQIQIYDINITTVCSPSSGGYQCRCEDQYRWSCDQCLTLGFCDNITGDTCGCINTIPPDGQYCQSVVQNNFTACPVTTPVPTPVPTSPAVVYEYIISIELNVSDVAAINQLRNILSNISYPVIISNQIQIYDINITTVCSPSSGGHQCRCEDQYRWSCDQCLTLGFCDNITGDTCGCINTIPPDGQYCQSVVQNNFTACPVTTPVPTPVPTSPAVVYEYIISIELNVSDVAVINQLRNILSNISYPVIISNQIQIYDINITTVCSPSSGGYQCRCEDQYRWSCDQCLTLGFCDNITGDTCGCINTIPPDGQYCQSVVQNNFTACPVTTPVPTPVPTSPAVVYEYIISIELNVSDVAVINQLRNILSNISYPVIISNQIQIYDINITTVCSPSSGGYQCRCEDQYRWSCDQCLTLGFCDNITGDTCGCINTIPPDGQYCQSVVQNNFTACPVTTPVPTPVPTSPAVVYEYIISIELNVSDVAVINQLRNILSNISYPVIISNQIQIYDINITTVCSPSSGGHQCRCEDQYRWSCDQCLTLGFCDNITGDTCGCINTIPPDGQYCQSVVQNNFTACPVTTPVPTPVPTSPAVVYEYIISIELNVSDVAAINQLRNILSNISYPVIISNQIQIYDINITTVCSPSSGGYQCRCEDQYRWSCDQCLTLGFCDNITGDTCGCINTIPPDGQYCQSVVQNNFTACPVTTPVPTPVPTSPAVVYEYIISIELNVSDVAAINQLRNILSNISYPVIISNQIQIYDINITTVCSPSSGGHQCRCEDQYRWSCDQCLTLGFCDNITGDTCGCINTIPPDGQYCQSVVQNNFTACPVTTPVPSPVPTSPAVVYEYIISIELNVSDVAAINQLRNILSNISYPVIISNQIQIYDINITTVCSPSSGGYQCRCEDQYRWSCDQCLTLGFCDNITGDTCGCINTIPPDGQYCQSVVQNNFTACPVTTPVPTPVPTSPAVVYEYIISIELNVSDVAAINQLRNILSNISYPVIISNQIQIYDINITTVCSPSSGGYQCRCEDQYRWSCDQCLTLGFCDNITGDTCGCINTIPPDGQYCQSVVQNNFTACPVTTPVPTPVPTSPAVVYEYIISIELNVSDVAAINQLRNILSNISYPVIISNQIQIYDINITTVCSPSSGGYQCRCEDQYRWSCDQCLTLGFCDNITGDTCGCINTIPPDGQYCQSVVQNNFTACPVTTPVPTPVPTSPAVVYEYIISIELNVSDVAAINQLRNILSNISYPVIISNQIQIYDINITTVCSPSSGGYQCRCEDQYRWSCDQCLTLGFCDNITGDTCGCINTIPPDGQYCQSVVQNNFTACPVTTPVPTPVPTSPAVVYEYIISIELNVSDVAAINQLRNILSNISYPVIISNQIQIYDINITTVCSPSSGGYQCRCEDQYRWSCDQCLTLGFCDNITGDTCGCINTIPPDGQYCQSVVQNNFTSCPVTTPVPTPVPTSPAVVYEYIISIELNVSDVAAINQLRNILSNISYPVIISNQIQIYDINITTVCSPTSGGYQCRCEDQYRWSCDQCLTLGFCDNITGDTCGCINTIPPDGQYCQSVVQNNFTACPVTTPVPTPVPTSPAVVYEYIISIELNVSDVAAINQLRNILSNISYPVIISNQIQIYDINITTVCSPSSGGYQCRCEDQYRWSCDQCLTLGFCDNITGDTCGCINTIPPDGQYCQSVVQNNFTACPVTTPVPTPVPTSPTVVYEYIISIELNVSDVAVINQLRNILSNISYPVIISNQIQIYDINITTVCYPSETTYQCRCEQQFGWPCEMCSTFGKCNETFDNTCECINAIPPNGVYCQPMTDLLVCPTSTPPIDSTSVSTTDSIITTAESSLTTTVTDTTPVATTDLSTPMTTLTTITNSTVTSPADVNTTTTEAPTTFETNSTSDSTTEGSSTTAPTTTTITNSTSVSTTDSIITTAESSLTTTVTDTTPVATTDLSTPMTTLTTITNSTVTVTPDVSTTTTEAPTTFETNSTVTSPADVSTTTTEAPTTFETNSTSDSTTEGSSTTAPTTTTITNSTSVSTTDSIITTAESSLTTTVTNTIPVATTDLSTPMTTLTTITNSTVTVTPDVSTTTTEAPTTFETNSTVTSPADVSTTTTEAPTTFETNSTSDSTTEGSSTTAPTTTTITNSTSVSTSDSIITTAESSLTTTVTNTIPVATTDLSTPMTTLTTITNSTVTVTPDVSTTTTEAPTTFETNSTVTSPADVSTTTTEAPTTFETNSTSDSTTESSSTTAPTTTTITNSTSVSTTDSIITTTVTNTTPVATTDLSSTTPMTTSTTITITVTPDVSTTTTKAPTTFKTNSAPVSTTEGSTTTAPTSTTITSVTSQSTSGSSTMSSTSTIAPTTYLTTATSTMANTTIPTTTTPMANTTISNQSTTTANNTTHTTVTTPAILTTTLTTTTTTATTTIPITTTTTTTSSTASTTLSTTATTPQPAVLDVQMSIKLNYTYTQDLSDKTTSAYKNLESRILTVLVEQYKGITGFIRVFVDKFRQGSVITDFVVQATQVNGSEIAAVNQNLPVAMSSVAPVIGSVSAVYNSLTPISTSGLIYTGSSMVLTCEPPSGIINKGSTWTFNSLQIKSNSRITITDTGSLSTLTVNNVILDDIGTYGCTLMSSALDFVQSGVVTAAQIKQAPNLQLQSLVNVKCTVGQKQPLLCCVQQPYTVQWFQGTTSLNSVSTSSAQTYCITYNFQLQSCSGPQQSDFTCMVDNPQGYKMTTTVKFFTSDITCNNSQYGSGQTGDTSVIGCDPGQEGSRTAVCQSTGQWIPKNDTCIVTVIKQLLIASQTLTVQQVPTFVMQLKNAVLANETQTATSSATVSAIVDILNTIANVPTPVNETVMRNVLDTVNAIIGDDAKGSWEFLNSQELNNASSILLGSLETISDTLDGAFSIITPLIQFNRTMISNFFKAYLNSSVTIDIPNTNTSNAFITTILFSSLNNVLSTRNSTNTTSNGTVTDSVINADVVLVKINSTIQNVTLKYAKLNNSLTLNPRCVFWNFKAFKDLGAWDDEGCNLVSDINNTVTCNCNHLTSFSILMSTYIPPSLREALDIITYVGVGISLASLVICLIIEAYVWKAITRNSTAYMRHVSIVNTALSLLIGDICFIIGASIAKNPAENAGQDYNVPVGPCSTATFFMHFFYLALFFWMLVSGLLLFYRTVMVFSHMSKSTMLAIGFSLGYGCPLIIAVITVAVTAPGHGYIRRDYACWLNWTETMALLALVIPALSIVFINILIIIVVVFKMLRRGVGDTAQRDEKHTLVVVARCVIILTPLFGLTWSLGVGTMLESTNKGIHIAFAFFNSLQGFFILLFGTLYDSKVRAILSKRSPTPSTGSVPRSSNSGVSSLSGLNFMNRLRRRAHIYRVSEATNARNSHTTESYVSI
ncbi:uncharacterized threonine-rich GPI-anchored glycoprotein PJ4664.02-like isoform X2 [Anabas testudineus]|uniref:uncharacterized threonine-rich GPI-anchored glycoprotein PJ4664.02-like isoform X2 n=1 Tax=Anabas testudineus TaxID=64144 RepID=UPI000E45DC3B|nr:uncharacterized threonine-rich GPI-anchored glycoprotein PJ4664.02-like isoform X2 [Anabas testudineus]